MNNTDIKKRDPRVQIIRSHGRRVSWREDIRSEISTRRQFDALDKKRLADCIVSRYHLPIGIVNREIDRVRRYYGLSS